MIFWWLSLLLAATAASRALERLGTEGWAPLRGLAAEEEDGGLVWERYLSREEGLGSDDDEDSGLRRRLAHGTTTVGFIVEDGIVLCVDSRASMGSTVGSSETQKLLPISRTVVATMAGGAADCAYFIRYVSARAKLHALTEGRPLSTRHAARMLATTLRRQRGLSVGTMVAGVDDGEPQLCYVDSDGARVAGNLFAVGSGSTWAYSVLDGAYHRGLSRAEALDLAERAVRTATERDAFSGPPINLFFVDKNTGHWARIRHVSEEDHDDVAS